MLIRNNASRETTSRETRSQGTISRRGAFALTGLLALAAVGWSASGPAWAESRVTLKSAKSTSSYYQMMVQLGEALKAGSGGAIQPTVEESQGSVQNVKEAARRDGNFLFTSPPSLITKAQAGEKPFEPDAGYGEIRALFTIPYLTMHWVVRADSGVTGFADLAGKDFIPGGKGSFGQRKTEEVLTKLGLLEQVNLVEVELDAAAPAVKNRQVVGFATAGSYPAPNVMELAAGTPIRLLSLSDAELAKVGGDTIEIPAGTYPGVDSPTRTLSLPVGAYATTRMDDDTAYAITKAFWEQRESLAGETAWWSGVTPDTLATLAAKLHPGALRYYKEAGVTLPDALM